MIQFFDGDYFLWIVIVLFILGSFCYLLQRRFLKSLYMFGAALVNIAVVLGQGS